MISSHSAFGNRSRLLGRLQNPRKRAIHPYSSYALSISAGTFCAISDSLAASNRTPRNRSDALVHSRRTKRVIRAQFGPPDVIGDECDEPGRVGEAVTTKRQRRSLGTGIDFFYIGFRHDRFIATI